MLTYEREEARIYSAKVKGMAGIICIVKPLLEKNESEEIKYPPFIPASEDTMYFGYSLPSLLQTKTGT